MNEILPKEYIDQRFEDSDRAVQAALASAEKAVNAALVSSEKAVDKAEASAERWRQNANEWRGAMGDRERDFLTRKEFYSMVATAAAIFGIIMALR